MKIKITLCVLALLLTNAARSQSNTEDRPRKMLYYFNGGIGIYIPTDTHGALSETGFANSFQFQIDYKKHFFSRLYFDQYNIAFHTLYTAGDGSSLFINGKVPSSVIGLDVGYRWHVKRFSPYVYAGTGGAITDVPYLKENTSNDIEVTTGSHSSLAWRGGVGVTYKLSKMFILYIESQYVSFPITTQVYSGSLDGMSLQIGFKTPLQ
jgi:opacity protein-like surface antigen